MSIASFFAGLFGENAPPHAAVAAAPATTITALKAFAGSEASKIIAGLKETHIGTAVANDISALSSSTMTGEEKMAQVVSNTAPLIVEYLSGGGIAAVEADVLSLAKGLAQTIYLDVASTSFGKIAGELLRLLGI